MQPLLIILILGVVSVHSDPTEIEAKLEQVVNEGEKLVNEDTTLFKTEAKNKNSIKQFVDKLNDFVTLHTKNNNWQMIVYGDEFISYFDKLLASEPALTDIDWDQLSNKLNSFEELAPITQKSINYALEWINDRRHMYLKDDIEDDDNKSKVKLIAIQNFLNLSLNDLNNILSLNKQLKENVNVMKALMSSGDELKQVEHFEKLLEIAERLVNALEKQDFAIKTDKAVDRMNKLDSFNKEMNRN